MKRLNKIIYIVTAVFLLGSCNLDEDLKDAYNERPESSGSGGGGGGGASGLSTGYATLFGAGTANHGGYFSIQEVSSDEAAIPAKGGDWFDGGIWVDMHRHEYKSTSDPLNTTWTQQYDAIAEINDLLGNPNITSSDSAVTELHVLRAYYYFRLLDTFGRVKIVTAPGQDVAQSTRTQVFEFVESELTDAIESGFLRTNNSLGAGRVNLYGAYGLRAILYLNAEVYTGTPHYTEAAADAAEVINSGLYSLPDDYSSVFSPTNSGSPEHVWVVPFDQTTGTGMNLAQMTLHYGSQETFKLAEQPWNGYTSVEEFYNSYSEDDERKENNFLVGPQFKNPDGTGGPVIDFATESTDEDGFQLNYTPRINELFPNAERQGGARMFKFNFAQNQRNDMNNDYPIVRFGDMLLVRAEALARAGGSWNPTSESLTLINDIRARAGVDEYTTTGEVTESEFLAERGREMFLEASRRRDLIRFGRWGDEWWEKPAHSDDDLNLFPIPLRQIQASASTNNPLTQNPGY